MRICLLALSFAIAILNPAKGYGAFDEPEMEARSDHVFVCGEMFQRLASAGVEEVAMTMKDDLLRLARTNGGSQSQLLELGEVFEEGRTTAEYEGFITGSYPRKIDVLEYAKFGERVHKSCTEWSYARPS